jgi:hypothetical protein
MSPTRSPGTPPGDRGLLRRHGWWLSWLPFVVWLLAWAVPEPLDRPGLRDWCRRGGWAALLLLAAPYVHVLVARSLKLAWRTPPGGHTWWLRVHIGAAFAAFLLTLFHSRGHANNWVTYLILLSLWVVMLSGVVGYWGRVLIYRLLAVALPSEFGRANLVVKERSRLRRRAVRLIEEYWKLTEYDVTHWRTFCQHLNDEERGLKNRDGHGESFLKKAERFLTNDEALRALEQALGGERITPGQMNPLVGALNKALGRDRLCSPADFESLAGGPGQRPEEARRRWRLQVEAARVFDREKRWQSLAELVRKALLFVSEEEREKLAEDLAELRELWRAGAWKGDKNDVAEMNKRLTPLKGLLRKLRDWLKVNNGAAIEVARGSVKEGAASSRPGGDAVKAGDLSDALIRRQHELCDQIPGDLPKCTAGLPDVAQPLVKLLEEAEQFGSAHAGRPLDGAEEAVAGECCGGIERLLAALPGEPELLRRVVREWDCEVERRNRLFLEALSAEVAPSEPPGPLLEEFFRGEVAVCLADEASPPSWGWLFTAEARELIAKNRVAAVKAAVGPNQARLVQRLMKWVERRRQLNVEQWLDRLANCWLWAHGWAAVVLLVLVADHVIGSIHSAGWW